MSSQESTSRTGAGRIAATRMPPPPKQYSLQPSDQSITLTENDGNEDGTGATSFHQSSISLHDDEMIDQSVSSQISRDASETVFYIRDDGDKAQNTGNQVDFSALEDNEDSVREQMRIMEEIEQRRKRHMEASVHTHLSTSIPETGPSVVEHVDSDPDSNIQNETSDAIDVKKDQQAILENILKASSSNSDLATLSTTPRTSPPLASVAASTDNSISKHVDVATSAASASEAVAPRDLHDNDEEAEAAAAAAAAALGGDGSTIREEQAKILAQIEQQITGGSIPAGGVSSSRRRSVLEISILSRRGLLQLDGTDAIENAADLAASSSMGVGASAVSASLPASSTDTQSLEPNADGETKAPDESEQFLIEQNIILSQIEKKEENQPSNDHGSPGEEQVLMTDDLARALGADASRSQQLLLEQQMIFNQLREKKNDSTNQDDNNDDNSMSGMNWARVANEMEGSSSSLPIEDLDRLVSPPSDRFSASAHILGTGSNSDRQASGNQLREQMEILDAIRRDQRRGQSKDAIAGSNKPQASKSGNNVEDPEIREQREILESIQRHRLSGGIDHDDKGDEHKHEDISRQIQEQIEIRARNLSLAEHQENISNSNGIITANHISESSLPMMHVGHESYEEIEDSYLEGSDREAQHIVSPTSYHEEFESRALSNSASSTGIEAHPDHTRILETNSEPVGNDGTVPDAMIEATVRPATEEEGRAASQWTDAGEGIVGETNDRHVFREGEGESSEDNGIGCTFAGGYNGVGERHGHGTLTWTNGDRYEGEFCNGMIHGPGALYFSDGSDYEGAWKFNKMHGQGTRRFANGNVYIGNYANGKRFGKGQCFYANGDQYHGEWKNDKFHGIGRYYYRNRDSFEGTYYNGQREGPGKYQLSDGRVDIIRYSANERVGEGVRWSANRKRAWKLDGRRVLGKISLERAARISEQIDRGSGSTQNVLMTGAVAGPLR